MGSALITVPEDDPALVQGMGTKFTTECAERGQIVLPKSVGYVHGDIVKIISDRELRLRADFVMTGSAEAADAEATSRIAEKIRNAAYSSAGEARTGLPYKVLPYIQHGNVYGAVYKVFHRTDLLPLKAGVSIMTLRAMAADPNCKVKVVPVGLRYFAPYKFRSRAVVDFGAPWDVPAELLEMYKLGGAEKRKACSKFLDTIYDGLRTLTTRAPDYDTLLFFQAGRRLCKSPGQALSSVHVVELGERFIHAYEQHKEEPR